MNTSLKFTAPVLAVLGLLLGGCQPDIDAPATASGGSATFTTYIAVGNSLTAGYQSGGVSRAGQLQSYPSILATQFALVGGGAFNQPLFSESRPDGSGYIKLLQINGALTPVPATKATRFLGESLDTVGGTLNRKYILLAKYTGTDNQNLGIPGIKVADVTTNGYGFNNPLGFNPFFERLLPSTPPGAFTSYLQYVQQRVAALKPTFFTNWLGNNDVLGYASGGGVGDVLTSKTEFTTKYKQVLDVLTAGGTKGLVATIPNVTNVPLFTTVPTAAVISKVKAAPVPASTVALLTGALSLSPAQAATIRFGLFVQAITSTGAVEIREATSADLLLLPASAVINTPSTTANPFPRGLGVVISGLIPAQAAGLAAAAPANALANELVLDALEVQAASARTADLNDVIRAEASARGLALFDANAFFSTVASNGFATNGVSNSTTYVSGNLFSLDGVHPTPRGYAIIANEMLKAINSTYGSTFRGVNANNYNGTVFPALK